MYIIKKVFLLGLFLSFVISVKGQNSNIPFQGIALDNQNKALSQKTIGLKLSLLDGSSTGTLVYAERHTSTTDNFGLFQLNIGEGTALTSTFSAIDWSKSNYYVKVEMDLLGGTNYTVNTVTKLGYAPFAFYAQTAKSLTTIGGQNLAIGEHAMVGLQTGVNNVAIGYASMFQSSGAASKNTFVGVRTGEYNTADFNTGIGFESLSRNTTGTANTALGALSLGANTTASANVAIGQSSLGRTTSGGNNTTVGNESMLSNTTGYSNVAIGNQAMRNASTAYWNVAIGDQALLSPSGTVNRVVAIGQEAMRNAAAGVNNAIMIGERAGYVNAAQGNIGIGNYALNATTSGAYNTAIGNPSMERNTTGSRNTAVGQSTLIYNTIGSNNSVLGHGAMASNTTGYDNVAVGTYSMDGNLTGNQNVAIGKHSLQDNMIGSNNTSVGTNSMYSNTTGSSNTVLGSDALKANTSGASNVAIGANALQLNTAGSNNVAIGGNTLKSMGGPAAEGNIAIGANALSSATSIRGNTAVGLASMMNLNLGNDNTTLGEGTLMLQTIGTGNTAIGSAAMREATNSAEKSVSVGVRAGEKIAGLGNTFLGYEAGGLNTGSANVFVGYTAGLDPSSVSVSNSVAIGSGSNVTSSNTVSLGNASTTKWAFGTPTTTNGVFQVGSTTSNGNGAYLTAGGTWTNASSRAFKEDFQEIDDAELLSKINSLAITQWKYKNTDEYHIGPIAEDFKKAFNLGVVGDREHISTIDASGVALKGVQALYVLIDAQEKTISDQQKQIDELKALVSTLLKAKQ
jgi:hypothetical protein